METVRAKSIKLTGYLEKLLLAEVTAVMKHSIVPSPLQLSGHVVIFTPSDPQHRGSQLSLRFTSADVDKVHAMLMEKGIVCDVRRPDIMRVAPAPLYNSFADVFEFVIRLRDVLRALESK